MSEIDIKQLIDGDEVFYPQTDIHGLVNNGEYAIDDVPTIDSSNLVTSGGVASELALGAVYDVTAHNGSAQFASLQALLTDPNLNTLIPTNIRRGGMSIKFVSDNTYVQFRYMSADATNVARFTNVANWQGVDSEITQNSHNLLESGAAYQSVVDINNAKLDISSIKQILLSSDEDSSTTISINKTSSEQFNFVRGKIYKVSSTYKAVLSTRNSNQQIVDSIGNVTNTPVMFMPTDNAAYLRCGIISGSDTTQVTIIDVTNIVNKILRNTNSIEVAEDKINSLDKSVGNANPITLIEKSLFLNFNTNTWANGYHSTIPVLKDDIVKIKPNQSTKSFYALATNENPVSGESPTFVGDSGIVEVTTETTIEISEDCNLIINIRSGSGTDYAPESVVIYSKYSIEKRVNELEEKINVIQNWRHITNPEDLIWYWGRITVSGGTNYIPSIGDQNALFTYYRLYVKAGSTISCSNGIQFQIFVFDGNTYTKKYYRTFGTGDYIVNEDGYISIGIRKSDNSVFYNTSLLQYLNIDLYVKDLRIDKYNKRKNILFGNIPSELYVGQHTDETGFNQDTNSDDVYAAWHSLVTESSYITETDLGVSYNDKHIYSYTIKAPLARGINQFSNKKTPKIIFITGLHGDEKNGNYGMLYLIKDMIYNPLKNPVLQYLRDNVTFVVIPIANTYGWDAITRSNENGVNLNRNFGTTSWDDYTPENPTRDAKGVTPFDQVETQYIRDVINANQDACLLIDCHTNGGNTKASTTICYITSPSEVYEDYDEMLREDMGGFLQSLRSLLLNKYEVPFDSYSGYSYGYYSLANNDPTLANYVSEETPIYGVLHEVLAGSIPSGGVSFLGPKLTKYSPDTIQCAAEEIGNLIISLLRGLSR